MNKEVNALSLLKVLNTCTHIKEAISNWEQTCKSGRKTSLIISNLFAAVPYLESIDEESIILRLFYKNEDINVQVSNGVCSLVE